MWGDLWPLGFSRLALNEAVKAQALALIQGQDTSVIIHLPASTLSRTRWVFRQVLFPSLASPTLTLHSLLGSGQRQYDGIVNCGSIFGAT